METFLPYVGKLIGIVFLAARLFFKIAVTFFFLRTCFLFLTEALSAANLVFTENLDLVILFFATTIGYRWQVIFSTEMAFFFFGSLIAPLVMNYNLITKSILSNVMQISAIYFVFLIWFRLQQKSETILFLDGASNFQELSGLDSLEIPPQRRG